MKYLKFIIYFITFSASAQQVQQSSQYIWNSYLINPAIAGAENFMDWKVGYRNQWIGIEGAPKTMYLTVNGQIGKHFMNREDDDVIHQASKVYVPSKFAKALGLKTKKIPRAPSSYKIKAHHGYGLLLLSDKIGPFSTLSAYGSYSYHIPISREVFVSVGAFVGVKQYTIDISKITLTNDNDQSIGAGMQGMAPDGMLGVMMYGNKFYLGGSVSQVFYNTVKLKNEYGKYFGESSLVGHYFVMGGYRIRVTDEFAIVPSSIVRYLPNTRAAMDVTVKLNYLDMIWGGASLRNGDAIVAIAGLTIKNQFQIGYSYDYTISGLNPYSNGTHEIVVGFRFVNKPTKSCKPSYVW